MSICKYMKNSKIFIIKPKIEKLFSHLYYKEKYYKQLEKSIGSELYDFTIILLWKVFMLFVYEKIYQISDDIVLEEWKTKFGKKPKGFKKNYLYWPNNVDDGTIINFLYELYEIDKNVMRIANGLSVKRDIAAHVSDVDYTLDEVSSFLDEILKLCEKIQNVHRKYLAEFDPKQLNNIIVSKKLSSQDIKFVIKKLIDLLRASSSFPESKEIREKILVFKGNLSKDDVKNILEAIEGNSINQMYHQVIQSRGADVFIKELYYIYNEPSPEWKNFAEFLVQALSLDRDAVSYLSDYNWLFDIFGMAKFETGDPFEEVSSEDIPF